MTAATTPEPAAPPPKPGLSTKAIAMAVAALVVGGALGLFVVAPRLRGGSAEPAAAATPAKDEAKKEPPRIFRLDNVIVNPAGTLGQRFLIVSVAVEVNTPGAEENLKRADVAFRDAVTGLLERMTLNQLTQLNARDTVRAAVIGYARKFAADTAVRVYLPQFLIQ